MDQEKTYYIYVDWTTELTPRPFYVGKGDIGRVKLLRRNFKHSWVKKHFGFERRIHSETFLENAALAREIALIKELDTFNHDFKDFSDIRCNLTEGGDGISGYIHSEASKKQLSESRKKLFEHESAHENLRNVLASPEVKQKRSEAQKLAQNKPETVAKRSKSMKGRKFSPETLERMRLGAQKRWKNKEEREKQSCLLKLAYENPDIRQKISDATREAMQRDDVKKNQSDAQRRRRVRESSDQV